MTETAQGKSTLSTATLNRPCTGTSIPPETGRETQERLRPGLGFREPSAAPWRGALPWDVAAPRRKVRGESVGAKQKNVVYRGDTDKSAKQKRALLFPSTWG